MKTTETLEKIIQEILSELGVVNPRVSFDHPTELSHGDYSTNAAMACEGIAEKSA